MKIEGQGKQLGVWSGVDGGSLSNCNFVQEIIALRESLTGMQSTLKQQHNQILSLKDEMHTLQLKMSESGWSHRDDMRLEQVL